MADDGLPTRAQSFAEAWRCNRRALLDGAMASIEAAYERRLIIREAKEEGVLDELVGLVAPDLDDTPSANPGRSDGRVK